MPTSASSTDTPVWGAYSRAALEAQHNLSQHPGRAPAYARFSEASAAVRARLRPLEIAYGTHPRERFELYAAPAKSAPVFVFIHGGYWRALDMRTFSFLAAPLVASGAAVVNLEYPLAPEFSMPAIAASVARGIDHALNSVTQTGADRTRVVVSGHSAGGQLAALAASSGTAGVIGTLPVSGLFELEPLRWVALNETLGMSAEIAQALSPGVHGVPTILAVGGEETDEFQRQSRDYARRLSRARVVCVPGANHFTVLEAFERGGLLHDAACELLAHSSRSR